MASDSWARPNLGYERGGNGIQDIVPAGERGIAETGVRKKGDFVGERLGNDFGVASLTVCERVFRRGVEFCKSTAEEIVGSLYLCVVDCKASFNVTEQSSLDVKFVSH